MPLQQRVNPHFLELLTRMIIDQALVEYNCLYIIVLIVKGIKENERSPVDSLSGKGVLYGK